MIIQIIETVPATRWWPLSPACLIDKLLDEVEKLRSFLVLVEPGIPSISQPHAETQITLSGP